MTWTGSNLNDIKICRISDLILICLAYLIDKGVNSLILYNAYGTSAETGTGHTGTNNTVYLPCFFYQSIQLDTCYLIIIPQRYMGSIHQLTKQLHIVVLQSFYRTNGSLILIYSVLCALSADIALDNSFELLESLLVQITQSLDLHYLLQFCQCSLALAATLIVLGISQASLFIAACDNDLRIFQMDRCVLIFQSCGVQKNSGLSYLLYRIQKQTGP